MKNYNAVELNVLLHGAMIQMSNLFSSIKWNLFNESLENTWIRTHAECLLLTNKMALWSLYRLEVDRMFFAAPQIPCPPWCTILYQMFIQTPVHFQFAFNFRIAFCCLMRLLHISLAHNIDFAPQPDWNDVVSTDDGWRWLAQPRLCTEDRGLFFDEFWHNELNGYYELWVFLCDVGACAFTPGLHRHPSQCDSMERKAFDAGRCCRLNGDFFNGGALFFRSRCGYECRDTDVVHAIVWSRDIDRVYAWIMMSLSNSWLTNQSMNVTFQ